MLVVDGYNLLFAQKDVPTALSPASMETARNRLLAGLDRYFSSRRRVGKHGRQRRESPAVVVFDGTAGTAGMASTRRGAAERRVHGAHSGVDCVFTGAGVSADSIILDIVRRRAAPSDLTVVTSDTELARAVRAAGAEVVTAQRFLERLARVAPRRAHDESDDEPLCKRLGISRSEAEWWETVFKRYGLEQVEESK